MLRNEWIPGRQVLCKKRAEEIFEFGIPQNDSSTGSMTVDVTKSKTDGTMKPAPPDIKKTWQISIEEFLSAYYAFQRGGHGLHTFLKTCEIVKKINKDRTASPVTVRLSIADADLSSTNPTYKTIIDMPESSVPIVSSKDLLHFLGMQTSTTSLNERLMEVVQGTKKTEVDLKNRFPEEIINNYTVTEFEHGDMMMLEREYRGTQCRIVFRKSAATDANISTFPWEKVFQQSKEHIIQGSVNVPVYVDVIRGTFSTQDFFKTTNEYHAPLGNSSQQRTEVDSKPKKAPFFKFMNCPSNLYHSVTNIADKELENKFFLARQSASQPNSLLFTVIDKTDNTLRCFQSVKAKDQLSREKNGTLQSVSALLPIDLNNNLKSGGTLKRPCLSLEQYRNRSNNNGSATKHRKVDASTRAGTTTTTSSSGGCVSGNTDAVPCPRPGCVFPGSLSRPVFGRCYTRR
eukprot:GHVT01103821.1.p1 GENE.GHVT01103821.1~~GHVT01103821.1.p1  ORF type:complete len:458 (+),score=55.70 GHVT01103821.1:1032-2405(+)